MTLIHHFLTVNPSPCIDYIHTKLSLNTSDCCHDIFMLQAIHLWPLCQSQWVIFIAHCSILTTKLPLLLDVRRVPYHLKFHNLCSPCPNNTCFLNIGYPIPHSIHRLVVIIPHWPRVGSTVLVTSSSSIPDISSSDTPKYHAGWRPLITFMHHFKSSEITENATVSLARPVAPLAHFISVAPQPLQFPDPNKVCTSSISCGTRVCAKLGKF